jgi:hypothetical protein
MSIQGDEIGMSDQIVQQAYDRVRSRFSDDAWFALPPRALTEAIYREMREIDAERAGAGPGNTREPVASAAA